MILTMTTTDVFSSCDHCDAPPSYWPTGVMCIDREPGVFTCDFVACPTCAAKNAAYLAHDIEALQLDGYGTRDEWGVNWYWFVGRDWRRD